MVLHRFFHRYRFIATTAAAVTVVVTAFYSRAAGAELRSVFGPLIASLCSSSSACLQWTNTGTGAGLRGLSAKGKGVVGQTTFNSTSFSNQQSGIYGQDLSTTGTSDAGVWGTSTHGIGVYGVSTSGPGMEASSNTGFGITALSFGGSGAAAVNASSLTNASGVIAFSVGGQGIKSQSVNLQGAFIRSTNHDAIDSATTHNSSSAGYGRSGVYGHDDSTDGGHLNVGVAGASTNGFGVVGVSSKWVGVEAQGGFYNGVGVTGLYPALSINGIASTGGVPADLIDACAPGNAVPCRDFDAAFLVDGSGNLSATTLFAHGAIEAAGDARAFGNLFAISGGIGVGTETVSPGDVNIIGQYLINGSCALGCALPSRTSSGRAVASYASTATTPTIEDLGEGQLVNGQAYVALDPAFANVVDQRISYLVFITPEGPNRGLYVTQRTLRGFAVRENPGGISTLAFSYRIVAKPYGTNRPRLPMVAIPSHHTMFEDFAPHPHRLPQYLVH